MAGVRQEGEYVIVEGENGEVTGVRGRLKALVEVIKKEVGGMTPLLAALIGSGEIKDGEVVVGEDGEVTRL